jgi:uncharacterized protein (DUF305 family)
MINDEEMLQFIMRNAEMGCIGINDIKPFASDTNLRMALRSQNLEYGNIYHNAYNILKNRGYTPNKVGKFVTKLSAVKTKREMKFDDSDSHIAQMMIQGNTMGVQKIAQRIRQYDGDNELVGKLADKLMSTEQANIEQMKSYL